MSRSRSPLFPAFAQSIAILSMAYMLILGGTYNGILNASTQQASLGLLTIAAVGWLAVYLLRPLPRLSTPLDPALFLWGGAYLLSILAHPSGRASIGAWYAGLYAAVWYFLVDLRRRGLPGRWLVNGALVGIVPLVVLACVQVAVWLPGWFDLNQGIKIAFVPPRPASTLGHPNIFATLLAMLLPLGVERLGSAQNRFKRTLWLLWVGSVCAVLYLTYSRGGWLAAGAGLLVLAIYHMRRISLYSWWQHRSSSFRFRLMVAIILFLAAFVVLGILSVGEFNTPRRGIGPRFTYYRIAAETFWAHPLTGTGPFTFGLSILQERSFPPEQPQAHAHNLVLNTAAELGLPGLLALVVTIYLIVRQPVDRACIASLAAFGTHGLVDMTMITPAVMLLMIVILAAGMQSKPARPTRTIQKKWRAYQLIPLVLWIAVITTGWWSARIYADYLRGEQLIDEGKYSQAATILHKVAQRQPSLALYHAQYAYACGLAAYEGDLSFLEDGITAYGRALDLEKPHAVWWANLAALYWQTSQPQQAIDAMEQAVRYAPKEADMWLGLGVYYEASGREADARGAYRRAIKARAVWAHSQFWDQTALRRDVLASAAVKPTPYEQAATLWQNRQHDQALSVLDQSVEHDPTQAWPYVTFARLYLMAGDQAKARDYLAAAKSLALTDLDQAWIDYVDAELARERGDPLAQAKYLEEARSLVLPGKTGRAVYFGQNIAYLQFLRLSVKGTILPQVPSLGPDPVLIDLLLAES